MGNGNKKYIWDKIHARQTAIPKYPSESVVRFLKKINGKRVLDLGCGGGRHTVLLAKEGFDAYATDISIMGLRHLKGWLKKEKLKATIKLVKSSDQPFPDNYFDGIICHGSLCYNSKVLYKKSINKINRMLKVGGKAFIVTRGFDDHRYRKGKKLDDNTYRLEIKETSEYGMVMHFLNKQDIYEYFKKFKNISINRIDYITDGMHSSDWLITVEK